MLNIYKKCHATEKFLLFFGYRVVIFKMICLMNRNFFEDQMNDLYASVQYGNTDCFYNLEDYLSDRGFREGSYGFDNLVFFDDSSLL